MTDPDRSAPPLGPDARALEAASVLLHSVQNREGLILSATRTLAEMLEADGSSVVLRDPVNQDLVFYAVSGSKSKELRSFRLAEGEGITGHCVRSGASALVNDVRNDPRFSPRADSSSGFNTRSILCAPLFLDGTCIGACTVVNSRKEGGFTARDLLFCEVVASHVAVAIRNVQLSRVAIDSTRLAALGHAVAGAAHCLKNLVLVLRGGVHIAKKEIEQGGLSGGSRGVALLEETVGRVAHLVDEMLTYAKDGQPAYARADLAEIVRSAVGAMEPAAQGRGVSVAAEIPEDLGALELDNDGIHRCILNLLSNAIDACEVPGSRVEITVFSAGEREVSIEVADEGCGMDSRTVQSLFQPFFTTKGAGGTGLGLSVTRKIIEEHGGRIEVDSSLGRGSTFRVFLPRTRPSQGDAPS